MSYFRKGQRFQASIGKRKGKPYVKFKKKTRPANTKRKARR